MAFTLYVGSLRCPASRQRLRLQRDGSSYFHSNWACQICNKLTIEPKSDPPSDRHMTGLAVMVLRDAGVPADDKRIQAAVHWLKTNQRESGRWWTRSLNTDTYHFITFSSTGYALLALAKCGKF